MTFSMSENAVDMAWDGVRVKAGLPELRFADLHHIGATFYAKAGFNAHQLQKVLGHKSTRMAEVYVNLANSDVHEATDRVEHDSGPARPLPPADVHAGRDITSIIAERRAQRLNGQPALGANVVRFKPRAA